VQYDPESPQKVRLALDLEFIKIINPNLDEKNLKDFSEIIYTKDYLMH